MRKAKPTRLALSAHAWGEPVPQTMAGTKKLATKGHELLEEYHRAKDGHSWVEAREEGCGEEVCSQAKGAARQDAARQGAAKKSEDRNVSARKVAAKKSGVERTAGKSAAKKTSREGSGPLG